MRVDDECIEASAPSMHRLRVPERAETIGETELSSNGFGVGLIRDRCDEAVWQPASGGTVVRLTFRRGEAQ